MSRRSHGATRLIGAVVMLFGVALVWNGLFHLVLIRDVNASVAHLRRPDMSALTWLSMLQTLGVCTMLVVAYLRTRQRGTRWEGVGFGAAFGLLAGLLVDINQYVLYPLPTRVVAAWFAGGMLEFCLDGLLLSWYFGPTSGPDEAPSPADPSAG